MSEVQSGDLNNANDVEAALALIEQNNGDLKSRTKSTKVRQVASANGSNAYAMVVGKELLAFVNRYQAAMWLVENNITRFTRCR